MNKVDLLPSEILSLILNYVNNEDLPSCALINKSFYREAMPLLWRTLVIGTEKALFAVTTWLMHSPHGLPVRSLSITNMDTYTDALKQVEDVSHMESLGSLQHIPRYCPHLTSLEIRCGRNPDAVAYRIAQAIVVSAGQYCKQLTKLVLRDCVYSDYDDLLVALKDAPLTEIELILPNQLDKEISQRFLETAPLALHRCPLTKISIYANNDNTDFITTINTHGLTWPHLTSFDVWRCESLTDVMALQFVQTNPTIERLDLGYSAISDVFLDALVDYLPNLTMLGLDFVPTITAPGICRLITNYGGLDDRVYCEGCGIYPENVPKDKTYDYQLMVEDGECLGVEWFDGTFS